MIRLEVRCCCQPEKLLGTLELDDDQAKVGVTIRATLHTLPAGSFDSRERLRPQVINKISLPVDQITVDGRSYPAVKAEGLTVEQLRKFFGYRFHARSTWT